MKLIIEIYDDVYKNPFNYCCYALANDIKNGTPLPKGHWERIGNDITLIQHDTAYYKCSECGEKVIGKHNYCQFCGAKMVEPQESEILDEQIQALKEFVNNLEQVEKGVYRVTEK